ncbi:unnamed protein product [Closterium sp. NIES-64]|nr:unnamed protein product [Closterium sp. NIES-64]CAI5993788.1 unnamed protein product [Closterium sp. NIES-65]
MANGLLDSNSVDAEPWANDPSATNGDAAIQAAPDTYSNGEPPAVLISGKDAGLNLPPETAENLVILEDPGTGHRAYIVGSAHVSKQAGLDVERVVSAVQPEILAVELDRERLKNIMAILAGDRPSDPPKTVFKALRAMYSAKMGSLSLFFNLQGSFVSALLGVPYGYDMMTAVKVAEDSGVRVALVDRSSFLTLIRLIDQTRRIPSSPPPIEERGSREGRKARFERVKRQMVQRARDAGCDEPAATFDSFVTVLATAFKGKEIPLDDFRRVRSCGRRVVETFRHSAIHHSLLPPAAAAAFTPPSPLSTPAGGSIGEGGSAGPQGESQTRQSSRQGGVSPWCPRRHVRERVPMEAVVKTATDTDLPPAIVAERDLILAQNIRKCTAIGPTVAVVGAGHIPGITHRWNDALTPSSRMEVISYLLPPSISRQISPDLPSFSSSSSSSSSSSPDNATIPDEPPSAFPITDSFRTAAEATPPVKPNGRPDFSEFPSPPKLGPLVIAAGLLGLSFYRPRAAMFIGVGLGSGIVASQLLVASALAKVGRVVGALEDAGRRLGEEDGAEVLW